MSPRLPPKFEPPKKFGYPIMKYQELVKEVEDVGKLKLSEQENFFRDVLNESSNDLEVRVAATLQIRKKIKRLQSLR